MLTSSGVYGDQSRCEQLGISAYLTKPIRAVELRDAIARALGLRENAVTPADEPIASATTDAIQVLLVEDNVVNQKVATGLLTRRGHQVTLAQNGQEALDSLARKAFDVVLMDVQMPVMGGLEATAAIRERERATGGHVRIVAMTAHAMNGDRERCLAAGMDGYLSKPVDPQMLFAVVESKATERDVERPTPSPAVATPAGTSAGPSIPTFDRAELLARVDSDETLMVDVIRMFLQDCPTRLAAIQSAVEGRRAEDIRTAAHALKGAAGNLSAAGLFEAARTLERLGAESRLDAAAGAWRALAAEAANVMSVLRQHVPDDDHAMTGR
jgi:CheY-like chemotaxis protein